MNNKNCSIVIICMSIIMNASLVDLSYADEKKVIRLSKKAAEKIVKKITVPILVLSTAYDAHAAYQDTNEDNDSLIDSAKKVAEKMLVDEWNDYKEIGKDAGEIYEEGLKPATINGTLLIIQKSEETVEKVKPILSEHLEKTIEISKKAKNKYHEDISPWIGNKRKQMVEESRTLFRDGIDKIKKLW